MKVRGILSSAARERVRAGSRTASRCLSGALLGLAMVIGAATMAAAQTQTVYNSIPSPLPGNVASEGPEAYAFSEIGDGLALQNVNPTGTFGKLTVILSSYACQSGHWDDGTCVTAPGATFSQPITVDLYSLDSSSPPVATGPIASITQTFSIPYRPSATSAKCTGIGSDPSAWFDKKDNACYHGLAVPISVNFSTFHLPTPATIAVGVSYNTSHYGPSPIGESAACFGTSAGCPYDSLNVSTDTTDGHFPSVGAPVDGTGIYVNYTLPNTACDPATVQTGVFADDAGCWTGFHPEIQVVSNQNTTHHTKGNGP